MSDLVHDPKSKPRLGRGLGSLLGAAQSNLSAPTTATKETKAGAPTTGKTTAAANPIATPAPVNVPAESRVWKLSIDKLVPSPYQPRQYFDKEKLQELAQSIRENGILQPIVARKLNSGAFEIIAGERRWRASQLAGLHEVPVILKEITNKEALELAIIENVQREDLNPIEEAESYQRLAAEFQLTQQQIAEKVGKDRATVANALRLLALEPQVRQMLVDGRISVGHSKVLLSLPDGKKQIEFAKKVEKDQISVRQLEKLVVETKVETKPAAMDDKALIRQKVISNITEKLQKTLGTKVSIEDAQGKGRIVLHYYSNDELNALIERLQD